MTLGADSQTAEIKTLPRTTYLERIQESLRVLECVKSENKPYHPAPWDINPELFQICYPEETIACGDINHPCDVIRCGFIWIASDPWHIDQGLRLDPKRVTGPTYHDAASGKTFTSTKFEAIRHYYKIDYTTALEIFDNNPGQTLNLVIARLKRLFATRASYV